MFFGDNLMPVKNIKKVPVYVWIPPVDDGIYSFDINGTDITDRILSGEITDGVTNTIGNFSIQVDNSSEEYTDLWSGDEILTFKCDYDTTATTTRFKGIIEKVSYNNNTIRITGRSITNKLMTITVTKSYSNQEVSSILNDLFTSYTSEFTTTNVSTTSTTYTVNWYQRPFWECITELCNASGFDCYIDSDSDVNFFSTGSRNNTNEAVVHESNLFDIGDFALDRSQIKNRVIVYGANIGDLPLIATAEDIPSGTIAKELIINDSNITTFTQAQSRADFELSLNKDPPRVGEVTSKGLATLQPGENIRISSPENGLTPNYYKIVSYRHRFDEGFFTTILTVSKEPTKIYHIIKDRISNEQSISSRPNANEMRYTWNFDFNTDTGSHSSTQIINGVLKSTGASGTWISQTYTLSSTISSCEIRSVGDALSGTNYYVSTNDGATWNSITSNIKLNVTPGNNLKIKVEINSSATQIDSLVLLYK
jgi:hypothetical protein